MLFYLETENRLSSMCCITVLRVETQCESLFRRVVPLFVIMLDDSVALAQKCCFFVKRCSFLCLFFVKRNSYSWLAKSWHHLLTTGDRLGVVLVALGKSFFFVSSTYCLLFLLLRALYIGLANFCKRNICATMKCNQKNRPNVGDESCRTELCADAQYYLVKFFLSMAHLHHSLLQSFCALWETM